MENLKQVVVFRLGENAYAMPIDNVKEIVKMTPITKLVKTQEYIEGMINIRDEIHVIQNLRVRFNLDKKNFSDSNKIIICNDKKVGFIVDEVCEIIYIENDNITDVNKISGFMNNKYLQGIINKDNEIIVLLNVHNLLEE